MKLFSNRSRTPLHCFHQTFVSFAYAGIAGFAVNYLRRENGIAVNDKTLVELHNIEKKPGVYAVPFPKEI